MELRAATLDDALDGVFRRLLEEAAPNAATRGATREILGVLVEIEDPRARLSRSGDRGKLFSALGELLWYLSRGDELDFIKRYIGAYGKESADGVTVHGAYGPRLFDMRGVDQVANVIALLRKRRTSRKAVVQLLNAEDLDGQHAEFPCTTTIQFFVRDRRLHMVTTLRSNDAYKGMPHDVFCFTMLQEMVARALGVELGPYRHFVGSMHVYEADLGGVRAYLDEGLQRPEPMRPMPRGDPFAAAIPMVLEAERRIRAGEWLDAAEFAGDAYWADLVRLLQAFAATGHPARLDELSRLMAAPLYRPYMDARRTMRPRRPDRPVQLKLEI